jgi:uncharacterized membrane protein
MRVRDQRGQITILLLTFAVCLILAISAVIDIAASYLRRQAGTSLADGAALSASDAAAAVSVYSEADFVAIDEPAARDAVNAYLRSVEAYAAYPGLHVDVSVHGFRITVALTMPYQLPVHVPGGHDSISIHVESTATMPIY